MVEYYLVLNTECYIKGYIELEFDKYINWHRNMKNINVECHDEKKVEIKCLKLT